LPGQSATHIVSILTRLGSTVPGGKVHAIFRRMNLFADRLDTAVTLLNMKHDCAQKIAFSDLVTQGMLDQRIDHRSIYEFCAPPKPVTDCKIPTAPRWTSQKRHKGKKTQIRYLDGQTCVMRDSVSQSTAGTLTTRQILTDPTRNIRLKYLGATLVESRVAYGDGIVEKTAFAGAVPLYRTRRENGALIDIVDFTLGQRFNDEIAHRQALAETHFPEDCIVFIDGLTSTHLCGPIQAQQVMFLHGDHRDPQGKIASRSKVMIETFRGDAIVTATQAHKHRVEADMQLAAPIRVIPHYTDIRSTGHDNRADICTVSRLDLTWKPIHQCIEAFRRIMHLVPECNYLIYGRGVDEARLQQLIDHYNCGDRVILMGHTDAPERVFSGALLSLAPTMTEGFGLAILEALTCDCPVISYDVDYGPREMIHPGINGELVAPGDLDAISQAILKVHADQLRYAAACRDMVQGYSFDAYRARYYNLIDDLIGTRARFDISAKDVRAEVLRALDSVPARDKDRLIDLYIHLSEAQNDIAGMYHGFHRKHVLHPNNPAPLTRCIWLSRRLGKQQECLTYLDRLQRRFPNRHATLMKRNPAFLELVDAAGVVR